MKKKMLMLATTAAMIEQFNKNNILTLEDMGYEIHVIGNWLEGNPISDERLEDFKIWLEQHHAKWFHMPSTRKPTDFNNFKAYKQVVELIKSEHYDFIHCHTPLGSVIGRCAALKTKTKIMYTTHGFHFYKGAPIKNWLLYYPVEKFLSRWTDILILITKEDYQRALNRFKAKRIEYCAGVGIDLKKFQKRESTGYLKKELGLSEETIMLLSVGEINTNKNHKVVIEAIAGLSNNNIHYCIAGKGDKKEELLRLAANLNIENQVHFLGFRSDVGELYNECDIFILPSLREGLNVSLMEAISCQTVVIASDIRGCRDLIKDSNYLFNPTNVREIVQLIRKVINQDNCKSVKENYDHILAYDKNMINEEMKRKYEQISLM